MKVFMFHYVKPFSKYYYFNLELFEKAINYLTQNYHVISLRQYDNMISKNQIIPDDYVMLTFDDGTIDHYKYVYPVLKKYGCSGLFFITSSVVNNKMLDIHIIHKLLEKESIDILFEELNNMLIKEKLKIEEFEADKSLDEKKTALFKQLLQSKLPEDIRNKLLKNLSKKYKIDIDSKKNYISVEEMKEMKEAGMFFGIHTCSHPRLSLLKKEDQMIEIKNNISFLKKNDLIEEDLYSIAFPYGSYNKDTLEVMKQLNIKYGFKANEDKDDDSIKINLIDRIDCNILKEIISGKVY